MTLLGRLIAAPFRFLVALTLQPDKQSHFYWGVSMGLCGLWMGWYAMCIVLVGAALKELYDLFHPPHECSLWDFLSTCIGGAVAIQLILIRLHHV